MAKKAGKQPKTKVRRNKNKRKGAIAEGVLVEAALAVADAAGANAPAVIVLSGNAAGVADGRIKNCEPSVVPPGELPAPPAAPPSQPRFQEDVREAWWGINNQLQTGACVGFGVGDGLLRWHLVKKGRITEQQALSVRYFWMGAKEMDEYGKWPTTFLEDEGTSIWAALKVANMYGCLLESELPINGPLFAGSKDKFLNVASQRKVEKVHRLEID